MGQVNQLKGQVNDLEGRVNDLAIAGRLSKIGKTPPIPYGRQQRSVSLLKVATANYLAREASAIRGIGLTRDLRNGHGGHPQGHGRQGRLDRAVATLTQEYLGDKIY
ncbi:MAG: hypothetical protein U0231_12610 [Nitrospiraceae bacterium]